jgi:alanine racemase
MNLLSSDIERITSGKLFGPKDINITEVITDSRHLSNSEGKIFFAINGKNHDGHLFINALYRNGIRAFCVEKLLDEHLIYPGAAFILVMNSVTAMQRLAAYIRKSFRSPVIAITGSAGKTIVKEWLSDILGQTTPVIRSPKSFNSQIGVPLSVLKLEEKYKLGIFEAGISLPGEMEKLQTIIDPDIGVITNIGDAHSENFHDIKSKAVEKLKLFSRASVIVYCRDQELVRSLIINDDNLRTKKLIDWSLKDPDASVFVKRTQVLDGKTYLNVVFQGNVIDFVIPFTDRASIENAVTVTAVCLALATDAETISRGLASLVSVAMRMELKSGINNCQLIEDFYNSDPGSLGMALEYLKSQGGRETTLILSDFVQSGRDEEELYGEVALLLRKAGIDKFIGVGKALVRNSSLFDSGSKFYHSTEDFIRSFAGSNFRNEIILMKGARIFEFEKIAQLLEQQLHQTVLEVSLDAISHNLNEFRRYLNPGTGIMAMVKAFAYGAGPAEIATLLEFHRVSYLAVAYADEGVELRNAGVTLPVMVMNPDPGSADLLIEYSLEPEIYSFISLEKFTASAARHGLINYPVHIKIDTGMHRLGFMPEEVPVLSGKLNEIGSIKVISVFSHLAASEDPSLDSFTHQQAKIFLAAAEQIRSAIGYSFLRHILNSAGIVRFPQYQFEMVRPGIGMYGADRLEGLSLKTAGRFKTRISQIKKISGGEPIGYGCKDISENERTIAILPVGYADGLNRKLGNRRGNLFIKGRRVPIIGNVCMDMCMVDITGLNAIEGDEAEIFGDNITISEIAGQCETIAYEILTSIPGRVKRIFFRE